MAWPGLKARCNAACFERRFQRHKRGGVNAQECRIIVGIGEIENGNPFVEFMMKIARRLAQEKSMQDHPSGKVSVDATLEASRPKAKQSLLH